jgi:hypothetical protein
MAPPAAFARLRSLAWRRLGLGKTYLIDHMAFTFLLDRDGNTVACFPPGAL